MEENYFVALREKTGNELELMFYAWYTYNMRVQFPIVMETCSREQSALQEEMRIYYIQQLKRRVKNGTTDSAFVSDSSIFGWEMWSVLISTQLIGILESLDN